MRCWRKRCARLLRNSLRAHWIRTNKSFICVCMRAQTSSHAIAVMLIEFFRSWCS